MIFVAFNALIIASAILVLMPSGRSWGSCSSATARISLDRTALLQPIADILKLLFKEELRPKGADKWLFTLAPILSIVAAFTAFATVPFGAETTFFGLLDEPIKLGICRRERRRARGFRGHVDGRVRHRARRLVVQQQVLALWRPASVGADDQLRAVVRHGAGRRHPACRLAIAA